MISISILTFMSSLSLMRVERGVTGSAMKEETSRDGGSTSAFVLPLAAATVVKVAAPNPSPANLLTQMGSE